MQFNNALCCIFDNIRAFLPIINHKIPNASEKLKAYTSLKAVCVLLNVPYGSATRGKRYWSEDGGMTLKQIQEIEIIKQKRK